MGPEPTRAIPKIGHQRPTRRPLDEDVVGLHVAMDHTVGVGVREGARHFLEDARGRRVTQRTGPAYTLPERLSVHVCHREEHEVLDLVHRENGNDPWVGELGRGARLSQETLACGRLAGLVRGQELDRHPAVEPQLARKIDDPHAPETQTTLQHVPPGERTPELGRNRIRRHGP